MWAAAAGLRDHHPNLGIAVEVLRACHLLDPDDTTSVTRADESPLPRALAPTLSY